MLDPFRHHHFLPLLAVAALLGATATQAAPTTPAELAAAYAAQAGAPGDAARGQRLFTSGHGREWQCASCHGAPPTAAGRHAVTGKTIEPLAPAVQPQRFTDTAKVEKWFRRNCNDVMGRECTAGEKADLLAYLQALPR